MDLKETYNRIAEDWHKDHEADDWWIPATDHFINLLKPGAIVLDVGCGGGMKAKYLTRNKLQVVGIDFSEQMIRIAEREVPSAAFFVADMMDLSPFIQTVNKKFDGIFAQASLLHIPKKNAGEVVARLGALLNPKGYLYVGVKGSRVGQKEEEVVTENDYGYEYERFFSYFMQQEIESYFKDAGLEIVYENNASSGRTTWIQVIGRRA